MSDKNDKKTSLKQLVNGEFSNEMVKKTKKYQKIYGFDAKEGNNNFSTHNNEADAFKHTFMQAYLTLNDSRLKANAAGNGHEIKGSWKGQDLGESNMDLWNNKIGREIGNNVKKYVESLDTPLSQEEQEDLIAHEIVNRMRKGELITNPNDSRVFKSPAKTIVDNINGGQKKLNNVKEQTLNNLNAGYNAVKNTATEVKSAIQTSKQFSDHLRSEFNKHRNKDLEKIFRFKPTKSQSSGNGKWVTIKGHHVFIDK